MYIQVKGNDSVHIQIYFSSISSDKLFDKYLIREEAETKTKKIKIKDKKKDGHLKIKAIDKFT